MCVNVGLMVVIVVVVVGTLLGFGRKGQKKKLVVKLNCGIQKMRRKNFCMIVFFKFLFCDKLCISRIVVYLASNPLATNCSLLLRLLSNPVLTFTDYQISIHINICIYFFIYLQKLQTTNIAISYLFISV